MTDKEILDGNKLIAEFMGAVTHKTAPGIISPYITNDEVWYGNNTIPNEQRESSFKISELKYHSSWDWLMPVIGKLTSECEEPEELDNLRLHIITNDILYAWKFVVNYLSDKQ